MAHIKDNSPTPLFRGSIFFHSRCFLDPLIKTKVFENLGMHYSGMKGHQYEKKPPKLSFFNPFFDTPIWGVQDFPWFSEKCKFSSAYKGMKKMSRNLIPMSFKKFSSWGIRNTPIFLLYPSYWVLKSLSKLTYFVSLPRVK